MVRGRLRSKASSLTLPFQPGVSRGWGVTASVADAGRIGCSEREGRLGRSRPNFVKVARVVYVEGTLSSFGDTVPHAWHAE